jgi:hypothetical protein
MPADAGVAARPLPPVAFRRGGIGARLGQCCRRRQTMAAPLGPSGEALRRDRAVAAVWPPSSSLATLGCPRWSTYPGASDLTGDCSRAQASRARHRGPAPASTKCAAGSSTRPSATAATKTTRCTDRGGCSPRPTSASATAAEPTTRRRDVSSERHRRRAGPPPRRRSSQLPDVATYRPNDTGGERGRHPEDDRERDLRHVTSPVVL